MVKKNFRKLESYPLTVFKYGEEEYKLAEVNISADSNEINYILKEPKLDKEESKLFYKTLKKIKESDPEFNMKKTKMKNFLKFASKKLKSVAKETNQNLTRYEEIKIGYRLYKEYAGFGKIEQIIRDPNIKYLFCERLGLPLYVYHKNPKYGFLKTNIKFESLHEFNTVTENLKLKSKSIKSYPDFIGVFDNNKLVEISDINTEFSINFISRMPIRPIDIVKLGIATKRMVLYLKTMIKNKSSILIIGGTESGRTELLNSLGSMVKKGLRTVTFEKYPKLVLPQENWYQKVLTVYKKNHKDVIKYYFRSKPEFVVADGIKEITPIIKNIKSKCQTFVSIDVQTFDQAMNFLSKKLAAPAIAYLDIVLVIDEKKDGWPVIKEIYEIHQYDFKTKKIKVNPVFFWNKIINRIMVGKSKLLS